MMDIQSIETAPKDGTRILLFWAGKENAPIWGRTRFATGYWNEDAPDPHWAMALEGTDHVLHPIGWAPLTNQ